MRADPQPVLARVAFVALLGLCVAACTPDPSKAKWEYRAYRPDQIADLLAYGEEPVDEAERYERVLNKIGGEGWQMVALLENGTILAKRQKPPEE